MFWLEFMRIVHSSETDTTYLHIFYLSIENSNTQSIFKDSIKCIGVYEMQLTTNYSDWRCLHGINSPFAMQI